MDEQKPPANQEHTQAQQPVAAKKIADDDLTFHLKIYSPFKVYYDGQAASLSAVNETGPFDILPKHKNFMTLLSPGELDIRTKTTKQLIRISRGIMHVKADEVTVFLDV